MRRVVRMLAPVLLMVAAALAACGSSDGGAALDWPATKDPVGTDSGLVWADRSSGDIHLADGTTLRSDRPITSFAVAGRGAYAVSKDDGALVEVTAAGVRETGAHVDTTSLKASPSGRYLAFIDPEAGPTFERDVHVLTSVVIDLRTGEEVFRSTRGMGDPDKDDLTDLYEDASFGVLGVTDETAWIDTPDGEVLAVDLPDGEAEQVLDTGSLTAENPWDGPRFAPEPASGPANADRTWGIERINREIPSLSSDPHVLFPRDELTSAQGARLVPRPDAGSWRFTAWLDSATVIGYANEGWGDPEQLKQPMVTSLLTCTVPDGSCTLVPDSEEAILPAPNLY